MELRLMLVLYPHRLLDSRDFNKLYEKEPSSVSPHDFRPLGICCALELTRLPCLEHALLVLRGLAGSGHHGERDEKSSWASWASLFFCMSSLGNMKAYQADPKQIGCSGM